MEGMKETQKTITNALAVTVIATLFFFTLTFILFDFFNVESTLKDAWETLGSFFGGITTLVAAYVASRLFNDWRHQHNKTIESSSAREVVDTLVQTKTKMRFVIILLKSNIPLNSNTDSLNNEISVLVDRVHNIIEDCMNKLEVFNLITNENDKESKDFLIKLKDFSESFNYFTQLAGVTQRKYIENKSQFILLAEKYVGSCDDFNRFLMAFAKAK